ncbi:hypothetical protein K491DRAFT_686819 [Lophiostoma macrostomum CBS 122681]|uniref:Uncharacterized protein n=1 Tax=Lophiostoma macrostomum CBS 122681 TaxID=1314788 RepID=A0A6A6TTU7_9PLEO|nr:hypothetical protein K491DRAFT_686819 [Lophiostoma macrostomum CBS 122681]
MSSYGVVRDLFDEGYLKLEDIVHNVQPFPTLVPYDEYNDTILVYKTESDLDVVLGQIQSFTDRVAQGYKKELWTWVVQLKVDDTHTVQAAKKARLTPSYPSSIPSQPLRTTLPLGRKPGYMTATRRTFDGSLLQEIMLLRTLFSILAGPADEIPNFIEFLYQYLDSQCGDGYGLLCATRREIPSLNDFDHQPVARECETILPQPTIVSGREEYQEKKWGLHPPTAVKRKSNEPPRDTPAYTRYHAACFKARDAAKRLLHEAGITEGQMTNYIFAHTQATKDMEEKDGPGLDPYISDREAALRLSAVQDLQFLPRLSHRGYETELVDHLDDEARQAAEWLSEPEGSGGPSNHLAIPAPFITPTPSSALNSNITGPDCTPDRRFVQAPPIPDRQLFDSSAAWAPSVNSLLLESHRPPASNSESQQDGGDASSGLFNWDAHVGNLPMPLGFNEATNQWNFGRWAGFSGDELGDIAWRRPRPDRPIPPWLTHRGVTTPLNVPMISSYATNLNEEDWRLTDAEWRHLESLSPAQLEHISEFVGEDMQAAISAIASGGPMHLSHEERRAWKANIDRANGIIPTSSTSGGSSQAANPQHAAPAMLAPSNSQAQGPQVPSITITSTTTSNLQALFQPLAAVNAPHGYAPAQTQHLTLPGTSRHSSLTPGIQGLSVHNPFASHMPAPILPPPTLPGANFSPPRQGISRSNPPSPIKVDAIAKLASIGSPVPPAAIPKGVPVLIYYPSIVVHHPIDYLNSMSAHTENSEQKQARDSQTSTNAQPDPDPPIDALMLGYLQSDNSYIALTHAVFLPTILRTALRSRVGHGGYTVLESYSPVVKGKAALRPEFGGLSCAHECAYDRLCQARELMMRFEDGETEGKRHEKEAGEEEGIGMRTGMGMDVDMEMGRNVDVDMDIDMEVDEHQNLDTPDPHPHPPNPREALLTKRWRITPGTCTTGSRGSIWEGWALYLSHGLVLTGAERSGAFLLVNFLPLKSLAQLRAEMRAEARRAAGLIAEEEEDGDGDGDGDEDGEQGSEDEDDATEYDSDGAPIEYDEEGNRIEWDSDGQVVPYDEYRHQGEVEDRDEDDGHDLSREVL